MAYSKLARAMAKRKRPSKKRKSSSKKRKSTSRGRVVARPKFAGKKYECDGKRVKTGKGKKKAPRVFCHRAD